MVSATLAPTAILCAVSTILASAGISYAIPASTLHDRCNAHPLEITQGPGGNPSSKGVGNIVSTDVPGIQEGKHIAYCKNVIELMKIHLFNRMIISASLKSPVIHSEDWPGCNEWRASGSLAVHGHVYGYKGRQATLRFLRISSSELLSTCNSRRILI
jgi:hypothetical protein